MDTISEYTATIKVLTFNSNKTLEAGSTSQTCSIAGHKLATGDFIINTTRRATTELLAERGSRKITVIDANTFTIYPELVNQTSGDTIKTYTWIDRTSWLLDGSLKLSLKAEGNNEASFIIKSKVED